MNLHLHVRHRLRILAARLIRGFDRCLDQASIIIRKLIWELKYPGLLLGPACVLGRGLVIRVSDGGQCLIGAGSGIETNGLLIAKGGCIAIGTNSFIGTGSVICACERVNIGSDALIGEYVSIRDQDHEFEGVEVTRSAGMRTSPIMIGNNVWIGAKSTITRGVTIGDNVVIGANSVVTRDVPSNAIAAGVPARVLRFRDPPLFPTASDV